MMDRKYASRMVEEIYRYCNQNQLFTCGSVEQYNRMFDFVRDGQLLEAAVCIYICSDFTDNKEITLETIGTDIKIMYDKMKEN